VRGTLQASTLQFGRAGALLFHRGTSMDVGIGEHHHLMVDQLIVAIIAIVVLSMLAARTTRDMNRRGAPGWIFGLLAAFLPPVGLVAWALGSLIADRAGDHLG